MKESSGRLAIILAVPLLIIPLALLTWLATRSIDQQESGMRERLRQSLLLEVTQTNARIHSWFLEIPGTLRLSAPRAGTLQKPTGAELAQWKEKDALVGIPFLIDASGSILYPSKETRLFYWRYLNVFDNSEQIPVYRNIAQEYESSIVGMVPAATAPAVTAPAVTTTADMAVANTATPVLNDSYGFSSFRPSDLTGYENKKKTAEVDVRTADAAESTESIAENVETPPKSAESLSEKTVSEAAPAVSAAPAARSKMAQSLFETDRDVQKQVYEQAAEEGKETLKRNVSPQIDAINTKDSAPSRSVIIETDSYFRDLVAAADSGLLPRIFDNTFVLLYWEKRGDWIIGCELDMNAVREGIISRTGNLADGVRYLAVLDQTGKPLASLDSVVPEAWRTPLVSGEISEFLPYWETAVLLSDPFAFESRVQASRYALGTLVLVLFLSIAGAVLFLLKYSSNRLLEARRRTNFVTTVSHELKTPLTSIRMYSEMLAEGADDNPEKRTRYLGRIISESERLTSLINNVLDVAKSERGKYRVHLEPFDLSELVRETLEGTMDRLRSSGFVVSFMPSIVPADVFADKEAVIRILVNLLSNAEKYSGEVKEITVSVCVHEIKKRVVVSVADRGIGIPRAHRSRIFKEFHRVDNTLTTRQSGTGLGLSIARSLARSLGGEIRYAPLDSSDYTLGSVFSLNLPIARNKDGGA